MKSLAVVIEEPQRSGASLARPRSTPGRRCRRRDAAGPASAPAPNGCSTPAGCRRFPAWAIRWCPATRRSARSSRPGPTPASRSALRCLSPARIASAKCAACTAAPPPHLVAPGARVLTIDADAGERGVLLALAATALHALDIARREGATLIVGHGALGRLLARRRGGARPGADCLGDEPRPRRAARLAMK